jgi:hypothetical protein
MIASATAPPKAPHSAGFNSIGMFMTFAPVCGEKILSRGARPQACAGAAHA